MSRKRPSNESSSEGFIELGYISAAHGLRGEVKVILFNPDSTFFRDAEDVYVRRKDNTESRHGIESVRGVKKGYIVGLTDIWDRNQAEALKGSTLLADVSTPSEDDDEFYLEQIRGFQVHDEVHGALGTIQSFMLTSMDIMVVKGGALGEVLLPVFDDTIREVEWTKKTVHVQTPEGLIGD